MRYIFGVPILLSNIKTKSTPDRTESFAAPVMLMLESWLTW